MLSAGARLGPYEIVARLGEGGMGEVYRARDTRLGRDVAIKVLPAAFAVDPDRLHRFEQEARATAALNHPNILSVFDVGSAVVSFRADTPRSFRADTPRSFRAEGEESGRGPAPPDSSVAALPRDDGTADGAPVHYLVEELLEGETLRDRLKAGTLPVSKAVEIASAIANGLAAAHAKGIVHRDLKPENVFITTDGVVKILDFGLAKLTAAAEGTDLSAVLTASAPHAVLGTAGYMAPEQVRGQPVDHRADIFALGCVLYEMLSGRRAFRGSTPADTMSAILSSDPPALDAISTECTPPLATVVRRCLEKQARDRFGSARDLAFAVEAAAQATPHGVSSDARPVGDASARNLAGPQPSIAVLPFANLSADPEQEYFCDGMAEEILNALAHVQGLRVIARTSSFVFKGRAEDVRQIGARLDVATLLEGSVRQSGDRLRITAQLINAADGSHLWSDRYDRRIEDVFAIQEEIALAIVDNLQIRLLGRERAAIGRRGTDNLDAHSAYLRGQFFWNAFTPEGFARSRESFEEAIRLDAACAPALSGLAMWYVSQAFWADYPSEAAWTKASTFTERALEADPGQGMAYTVRGNLLGFFERRWSEAEASLRTGVLHDPGQAGAHFNLAALLAVRRRWKEMTQESRIALRLDPLSAPNCAWNAVWLLGAGHEDEARAELERIVAIAPGHWLPHWGLAILAASGARPDEALVESETAVELSGRASNAVALLACVSRALGDRLRADRCEDELAERASAGHVAPTLLAWVADARRDARAVVDWLERAAATRDPILCFYRTLPAPLLSGDPAIEAVLARFEL